MRENSVRRSRCRRGSALVSVLIATIVLVSLSAVLISISVQGMRRSTYRSDLEVAKNLAEVGLKHGFKLLADDQSYEGQGNTWFPGGQFRVERIAVEGEPGLETLIGIGRVRSLEGGYIERRVVGTVSLSGSSAAWNYAIFTKQNQTYSGNFVAGTTDVNGPVHANGSISYSGDPVVYGETTAVGAITWSGVPTFHDGYDTGVAPKEFPTVDIPALKAEAAGNGIYNGDRSFSGNSDIVLTGKINGKLDVSGNPRIVLNGPVYVTGEINFSGNAVIGNGLLMADGKITLSGDGGYTAGPTQIPTNNLAILGLGTSNDAVYISGNPGITGGIYCPDGGVTISGNPPILGSILSDRLFSSGNGMVKVNVDYQPPSAFGGTPKLVGWQEQ